MRPVALWVINIALKFLPPTRFFRSKVLLLRLCGITIDGSARICSSITILGNGRLSVGVDTFIGHEVFIASSAPSTIVIGDYVDIAPRAYIGTGSHVIDPDGLHVAGKGAGGSITIRNGAWIGACAVIMPGVTIGEKSIVAAGAVVNRDVPPYTIVAGVPARIVRSLR